LKTARGATERMSRPLMGLHGRREGRLLIDQVPTLTFQFVDYIEREPLIRVELLMPLKLVILRLGTKDEICC
jgi:hypothetical protein